MVGLQGRSSLVRTSVLCYIEATHQLTRARFTNLVIKNTHEIRDPVHTFINLTTDERKVLNSKEFQRLRYIHQLALSYLVYPGATHTRFEHSLGTMELATRVFDVVMDPNKVDGRVKSFIPEVTDQRVRDYWRGALRMAALCHDIGHLPFSHAAEEEVLPDKMRHEHLTVEIIRSKAMQEIWGEMTPPLRADDIAKLAVGQKYLPGETFTRWEDILSEIIVGDAFGADRMDYLLRDSLHAGVAYGRFDHYRLIDTLRVLPGPDEDGSDEPRLGIEIGGIHSAEALLLARYFMYSQVYFHHVREIYDIHLIEFLREWLPGGQFSTDISKFLEINDVQVLNGIMKAADDSSLPGHESANRIVYRRHFRRIYAKTPADEKIYPDAGTAIYNALVIQFGGNVISRKSFNEAEPDFNFPVLQSSNQITSSVPVSQVLSNMPVISIYDIFAAPEIQENATKWLDENKGRILREASDEERE